jgi:hypothetical protein
VEQFPHHPSRDERPATAGMCPTPLPRLPPPPPPPPLLPTSPFSPPSLITQPPQPDQIDDAVAWWRNWPARFDGARGSVDLVGASARESGARRGASRSRGGVGDQEVELLVPETPPSMDLLARDSLSIFADSGHRWHEPWQAPLPTSFIPLARCCGGISETENSIILFIQTGFRIGCTR